MKTTDSQCRVCYSACVTSCEYFIVKKNFCVLLLFFSTIFYCQGVWNEREKKQPNPVETQTKKTLFIGCVSMDIPMSIEVENELSALLSSIYSVLVYRGFNGKIKLHFHPTIPFTMIK